MTDKPAYEELQQRVKELEKENQEHKRKYEELTRLRPEAAIVNELKKSIILSHKFEMPIFNIL